MHNDQFENKLITNLHTRIHASDLALRKAQKLDFKVNISGFTAIL